MYVLQMYLQLVDYLNTGSVLVKIMGKQYVRKSAVAARRGLTTKDMLKTDRGVFSRFVRISIYSFMLIEKPDKTCAKNYL